jgi:two-component system sensor histidine kinase KdpD
MRENAMHNRTRDGAPARHVASDALALQSALLASVSHDLRNPLSVILGASEMLQDSFEHLADEDRHSYLRAIRRECVRMDEYVHGMLHVARVFIGGSACLARERVCIAELANSAIERLMRYRQDARVVMEPCPPLRPVRINGPLVEQALLNVLDNAAKFSPPGAPVRLRIAQRANDDIEIEVIDEGPGIPPDQRERAFAMFASDDRKSRGRSGWGLGLAISRSILHAHGGDVTAHDRDDGESGARVRLVVPAQEVPAWSAR